MYQKNFKNMILQQLNFKNYCRNIFSTSKNRKKSVYVYMNPHPSDDSLPIHTLHDCGILTFSLCI